MNLSDVYNELSRRVDTECTKICVADTKRVMSEFFKLMAEKQTSEVLMVLARGLALAESKDKRNQEQLVSTRATGEHRFRYILFLQLFAMKVVDDFKGENHGT